jgi:hypothetical protein
MSNGIVWARWYAKNKKSVIERITDWQRTHPETVRGYKRKYNHGPKMRAWINKHKARLATLRRKRITVEYVAWQHMKQRCYNKKDIRYAIYGGRGIRVCQRWRNSFQHFISDMGRKPSPSHSLDRFPDNDGNYSPSNCRWATPLAQRHNQRRYKGAHQ